MAFKVQEFFYAVQVVSSNIAYFLWGLSSCFRHGQYTLTLYLFRLYCNVFCPRLLTGQEYAAIVEFAPFQKAAKKKSKKKDAKTGTIEDGIMAS